MRNDFAKRFSCFKRNLHRCIDIRNRTAHLHTGTALKTVTLNALNLHICCLGSSNAILVIDQMLKTSDVSFLTWQTKCGGHATVFLTGDVSAVTAAVESVKGNPPCEIVASAVISNPSEETVRLAEEEAARNHFM